MPCLEISMPAVDDTTRARLAEGLTSAFCEAAGFPADIFGIRFLEYGAGQASLGGRLVGADGAVAGKGSPYLHMLLYTPRLKLAVKRRLAADLTSACTAASGRDAWAPVLHFCEHPYDNVAVEGRLLRDAYPELASRPFYYSLADAGD